MEIRHSLLALGLIPLVGCQNNQEKQEKKETKSPNIILIMADDMGFSDLGCTGSEHIRTPNIDQLAENGILLNQFYNTSRSCPTRASLLTGLYQHKTGIGWMTASNLGEPGYTGDLNEHNITIAEALREKDYRCYMTGKWHVTYKEYQTQEGPKHNWPIQRGFDKFYGILSGGGGYYNPRVLVSHNNVIEPGEDYYLTEAINDSTVAFLDEHFQKQPDKPFFFYVAHYAPHRPLHALQEDIEKYEGKFKAGWDSLRKVRYRNQLDKNLIDSSWALSERGEGIPPWDELTEDEKTIWAKRMAVYAAQIDRMDQGIGRLIAKLKEHNQLDNTMILFLSDNGGCEEPSGTETTVEEVKNLGQEIPFQSYHKHWANVSDVPFRMYKSFSHEGGISTPLIVHWPEGIKQKGAIIRQQGHVIDLLPTFLELTGAQYPEEYNGNSIHPYQGKSLLSSFSGDTFDRGPMFFEHEVTRAVIDGDWKLVSKSPATKKDLSPWELYNLQEDRTETNNLIDKNPEKAEKLEKMWVEWANENDVFPLDNRGWTERIDADVNKNND